LRKFHYQKNGKIIRVASDCPYRWKQCPKIRCSQHIIWCRWKPGDLISLPERIIFHHLNSLDVHCYLDWIDEPHTLEEIGKVFHLTRERVRQIQDKTIRVVKTRVRAKVWRNGKLMEKYPVKDFVRKRLNIPEPQYAHQRVSEDYA